MRPGFELPKAAKNWLASLSLSPQNLAKFLSLVTQLGLLVLLIYQFELENPIFSRYIMPLVLAGFVVHQLLPIAYRLPFFALLSIAAIIIVFGLSDGLWLLGLGLLLIALCHLPLAFRWRIATVLGVAGVLAFLRASSAPQPWTNAIWPILGSMFMFRLMVYLYSLRHQKEAVNIWRSLSYFFLLPNVVFPLFPVVDFNTFRRTYYDQDRYQIYQRGVTTVFWGVLHLIAYRYVNYYLSLAPTDVVNVHDLLRYMLTTFLLYLRVSGQFHLIVGILHLFGFNLPVTHHLYYLSSSYTDFWRRINIYWKDFMLNVFYYPAYFRLRKRGTLSATLIATAVVFFCTWFLHAYQWFWLRGSFLLAWHDALFWLILGGLVMVNIIFETRHGRKRSLSKQALSNKEILVLAFKRFATFSSICLLWSFWSSSSVQEWLLLLLVGQGTLEQPSSIGYALLLILTVFGIMLLATIFYERIDKQETATKPLPFYRSSLFTGSVTAVLLLLSSDYFNRYLNDQSYALMHDLQEARLGQQDSQLLDRGYYEDLIGINRFNSELWQLYTRKPADWLDLHQTDAVVFRPDLLKLELKPNIQMNFKGAPFHTNQWAMRDKDYSKAKPAGTYRIALLGASRAMGSGVADEADFESLLEQQLNQKLNTPSYQSVEILNFAVGGYVPLQQLMLLQSKVLEFEPDAILYVASMYEMPWSANFLAERVRAGADLYDDYLRELVRAAGLEAHMAAVVSERRLKPYAKELVSWAFQRISETAAQKNIPVLWVFLPNVTATPAMPELFQVAEAAGFQIIDLSDVYEGYDSADLAIADWDTHPNARAHQLIVDALYEKITAGGWLRLELPR